MWTWVLRENPRQAGLRHLCIDGKHRDAWRGSERFLSALEATDKSIQEKENQTEQQLKPLSDPGWRAQRGKETAMFMDSKTRGSRKARKGEQQATLIVCVCVCAHACVLICVCVRYCVSV